MSTNASAGYTAPLTRVRAAPGSDSKERLGAHEKALLAAEIYALYPRVRWLMRTRSAPKAVAYLRRSLTPPIAQDAEPSVELLVTGLRLANAVRRTLRLLPLENRCLVQSLVLLGLLARRGVHVNLVIAVRPEQSDDFEAHAWVEMSGRPLLPTYEDKFVRLTEL